MGDATDIREAVRRRYAGAAIEAATASTGVTSCCGPSAFDACGPAGQAVFGAALYDESEEALLPGPSPPPSAVVCQPSHRPQVTDLHSCEVASTSARAQVPTC